jgi:hypothetical protein
MTESGLFKHPLTEMLGEKAQRFSRGMNRFIGFLSIVSFTRNVKSGTGASVRTISTYYDSNLAL